MTGFAIGSRAESSSDIFLAFGVGYLGEVEVTPVRLRLASKRGFEVVMGLRSSKFGHAPNVSIRSPP